MKDYSAKEHTYIIVSNEGKKEEENFHHFCKASLGLDEADYKITSVYLDKDEKIYRYDLYKQLLSLVEMVKSGGFNKEFDRFKTTYGLQNSNSIKKIETSLAACHQTWSQKGYVGQKWITFKLWIQSNKLEKEIEKARANAKQKPSIAYYLTLYKTPDPENKNTFWRQLKAKEPTAQTGQENKETKWIGALPQSAEDKNGGDFRVFRKNLFRYDQHKLKSKPWLTVFLLAYTLFIIIDNQANLVNLLLSNMPGIQAAVGLNIYNISTALITLLLLLVCTADAFKKAKTEIFKKVEKEVINEQGEKMTKTQRKCSPGIYSMFLIITYVPWGISVWMLANPGFFSVLGLAPLFIISLVSLTGKSIGDVLQARTKNPNKLKQFNHYDQSMIQQTMPIELLDAHSKQTVLTNPIDIKDDDKLAIKNGQLIPMKSRIVGVLNTQTKTMDEKTEVQVDMEAVNGEKELKDLEKEDDCLKDARYINNSKGTDQNRLIVQVNNKDGGKSILKNLTDKNKLLSKDGEEEQKVVGRWPQIFMGILALAMLGTGLLWAFISAPGTALQMMLIHEIYVLICACPMMILVIMTGPPLITMLKSDDKKIGVIYNGYNAFTINFKGDSVTCASDITGTLTTSPEAEKIEFDHKDESNTEQLYQKLLLLEKHLSKHNNDHASKIYSFLRKHPPKDDQTDPTLALSNQPYEDQEKLGKPLFIAKFGEKGKGSEIITGRLDQFSSKYFQDTYFPDNNQRFEHFKKTLDKFAKLGKDCSPIIYKKGSEVPKVVGSIVFKERVIKDQADDALALLINQGVKIALLTGGPQKVADRIKDKFVDKLEGKIGDKSAKNYITAIGGCTDQGKAEYIDGTYYDKVEDETGEMTADQKAKILAARKTLLRQQLTAGQSQQETKISEKELKQAISDYKEEMLKKKIGIGNGDNDAPLLIHSDVPFVIGDMCVNLIQKTNSNRLIKGHWREFINAISMATSARKTQRFGIKVLMIGFLGCVFVSSGALYPLSQLLGLKGVMMTPAGLSLFGQATLLVVSVLFMAKLRKMLQSIDCLKTNDLEPAHKNQKEAQITTTEVAAKKANSMQQNPSLVSLKKDSSQPSKDADVHNKKEQGPPFRKNN